MASLGAVVVLDQFLGSWGACSRTGQRSPSCPGTRKGSKEMGSIHLPWPAGSRRGRPPGRRRRLRPAVIAVAVTAALIVPVVATHSAAYGATGTPFGGTAAAVPGTVYAANYDTGGQGTGYNVTSTNGSANSYRSDGIDLEATADTQNNTGAGAYDMGWTTVGQWFNYTVHVATAC